MTKCSAQPDTDEPCSTIHWSLLYSYLSANFCFSLISFQLTFFIKFYHPQDAPEISQILTFFLFSSTNQLPSPGWLPPKL